MVIKNYKVWENTRGDGVQEEDNPTPKSSDTLNSRIIVSFPSGEVITVDNVNDLKELSQRRLITYYKLYKSHLMFCFCCEDQDISKIKYLINEFRQKRFKNDGFKTIAREFREQINKVTSRLYTITYNKSSKEFTAIIPDLNTLNPRKMEELESICIKLIAKYPQYDFQNKTRNMTFIGLEYLRTDD